MWVCGLIKFRHLSLRSGGKHSKARLTEPKRSQLKLNPKTEPKTKPSSVSKVFGLPRASKGARSRECGGKRGVWWGWEVGSLTCYAFAGCICQFIVLWALPIQYTTSTLFPLFLTLVSSLSSLPSLLSHFSLSLSFFPLLVFCFLCLAATLKSIKLSASMIAQNDCAPEYTHSHTLTHSLPHTHTHTLHTHSQLIRLIAR